MIFMKNNASNEITANYRLNYDIQSLCYNRWDEVKSILKTEKVTEVASTSWWFQTSWFSRVAEGGGLQK